jgi:hypothetical protein
MQTFRESGHSVVVCTSTDYKAFVESYGLEFGDIGLPVQKQVDLRSGIRRCVGSMFPRVILTCRLIGGRRATRFLT